MDILLRLYWITAHADPIVMAGGNRKIMCRFENQSSFYRRQSTLYNNRLLLCFEHRCFFRASLFFRIMKGSSKKYPNFAADFGRKS